MLDLDADKGSDAAKSAAALTRDLGSGIPVRRVWDMPWLIGLEFRRLVALPYIRLMFAFHGVPWGRRWRIYGMPIIQRCRGSQMLMGSGLEMRSWPTSNPLAPNHPVVLATRSPVAVLRIGRDVGMTSATLVAAEEIEIGDRVLIGANSVIVDTDFHPLDPDTRHRVMLAGRHRPVVVEDDAFVGMNALILKGVRIGSGAVVAAGSVVVSDVPPGAIVAGNPARIVGDLESMELE
jgi:acetyltransferase-like isoleucine patch superfamily enzyme